MVLANGWYLGRLGAIKLGTDSAQVLGAYYRAELGKWLLLALLLGFLLVARQRFANTWLGELNTAVLIVSFVLASVFVTLSNNRMLANWLNAGGADSAGSADSEGNRH